MEKLFTINNKDFNKINTTVLYTSSTNYFLDAISFIHNKCVLIDYKTTSNIEDIPLSILEEFNSLDLLTKSNLTKTDELKINILNSLSSSSSVYVFLNVLTYLDSLFKEQILTYLKNKNKIIINYTMDIEEALLLDYIIVLHDNKIIMEGAKESILQEEKILKKLGLNIPFIVELSIGLKYYNLIDKIYYDNESLVNALWN